MSKLISLFVLLLFVTLINPAQSMGKADGDDAAEASSGNSWSFVGPFGGDVRSLAIDPADARRLYLGTNDGQIYRSTDAATSWTRLLSFDHPGYCIDKLIIDETSPQTIYAPAWLLANDNDGTIYKSTDGGDNWQELTGMRGHSVRAFAIAPSDAKFLIAAAIDGAYKSTDAGKTWQRYSPVNHPDIIRLHSVAIDPKDPNIVYLGTEHLPWKTVNGGKDWVCVKGHPTEKKQQFIDDSDIFSIVIDRKESGRVFASACSGIYTSTDDAQNWSKFQGIPFTSRRTHQIYPDPTDNKVIYAGTTEGLWKTIDGGQSWQLMTSLRTIVNAIAIHPSNPKIVYMGIKSGGVLVSYNGGESFRPSNTGFVNRQVSTILADRSIKGRIYAGVLYNGFEGGLFVSNDNGRNWQLSSRGLTGEDIYALYQSPEHEQILYAGTNVGLYRSADRGENWVRVDSGKATAKSATATATTPPAKKKGRSPNPVKNRAASKSRASKAPNARITDRVINIIGDGHGSLLVASWSGLYRVNDNGRIEKIKINKYDGRVLSVAAHPKRPDTIFVGTTAGLYSSFDNAKTWQLVTIGEGQETVPVVQAISISPRDPDLIFIGTQLSCYLSKDGGKSWQRRGRGIPYGEAVAIRFSGINPSVIAVGDYRGGGLYLSVDGGENFQRIDYQLPSVRISTLSFDHFDPSKVYVGSFSGGVYVLNALRLTSQNN